MHCMVKIFVVELLLFAMVCMPMPLFASVGDSAAVSAPDEAPSPAGIPAAAAPSASQPEEGQPWMEAASFAELEQLLVDHWLEELYIRLTDDITVEADDALVVESRTGVPTQYLDTGEFTITVKGSLTLPFQMSITGKGGADGIFLVEPGGYLNLFACELYAEDGYAVRQEAGGIFAYYAWPELNRLMLPEEQMSLSDDIAWPNFSRYGWKSLPVVIVREGDNLLELLPDTDLATVFSGGAYSETSTALPVEWDIEKSAGQIDAQRRVLLTGHYPEIASFSPPTCLVVFLQDRPAVFTRLRSGGNRDVFSVEGYFQLQNPQLPCWLEWSEDGTNWKRLEEPLAWVQTEDEVYFWHDFSDISLPLYLTIAVEAPTGQVSYSNVLLREESDRFRDMGGNRGGGTGLGQGSELPPVTSTPKPDASSNGAAAGPDRDNHPSQGSGPDRPPVRKPQAEEPSQPSPPTELPEPSDHSAPQPEVPALAHNVSPSQAETAPGSETEPQRPAENSAAVEPTPPPSGTTPDPVPADPLPGASKLPDPAAKPSTASVQIVIGCLLLAGTIGIGIFRPPLTTLIRQIAKKMKKQMVK